MKLKKLPTYLIVFNLWHWEVSSYFSWQSNVLDFLLT